MTSESTIILLLIIMIVVLVILIPVVVFFVLSYNRKALKTFSENVSNDNDHYKKELQDQNDALIKQIIEHDKGSTEILTSSNLEKDLIATFVKLREAIKESCISSMTKIGAVRLAIYLFHNGTRSTHGINFFKISCICEKVSVGSGVRERMFEHTNIPINLFDDMMVKLVNNNRYIIINNEDIENSNHKVFISADKVKYAQLIALYDLSNNLLGFVIAEMDHEYSKEVVDKEREELDDLADKISPVLSYSDYANIDK